jgi:hypothetical protein
VAGLSRQGRTLIDLALLLLQHYFNEKPRALPGWGFFVFIPQQALNRLIKTVNNS